MLQNKIAIRILVYFVYQLLFGFMLHVYFAFYIMHPEDFYRYIRIIIIGYRNKNLTLSASI